MLKNSFKLAFRNLLKNKVYSGINISGLAIGMAGAIIIFQLVSYHLGVDRYHRNAARTYRVVVDLHLEDGSVEKEKGSAYLLHETLKKEYGDVESASYLAQKELTIAIGNRNPKKFLEKENAAFTNPDFFKIFDYQWVSGNAAVLNAPNTVVLTERYARKYFGKTDAIGQYIRINNQENAVVAGIIKDYPEQTDFKRDLFVSLPTLKKLVPEYGYQDWGWIDSGRETYITLRSAEDKAAFEKQMPAFAKRYYGADSKVFHYHLQELADVHFNVGYGGKIKYSTIIMLGSVGLLLVLIACFNFINLSTAQAFKRGKEVGVRKVLGVSQAQVFWLFIQETALFTIVAFVLAIVLSALMAMLLTDWLGIHIQNNGLTDFRFVTFTLLLLVFVVAMAGFYPAVMISNFNPLLAIKGLVGQNVNGHFSVRKGLVVVQFAISFVMIAVSMVIILQSRYLKNKDLGVDKDLVLHLNLPETESGKINTFRNEVMRLKDVASVSFFRTPPSAQLGSGGSIKFENRDWEKFVARSRVADHNYIKTYGLKLVAGRNLVASDTLRELLINQKLVKALGLKSPDDALNRRLLVGDADKTGVIVGVLSDFNNSDLYTEIEPTVIFSISKRYRQAGVKLSHLSTGTIQDIERVWSKQFPDQVFQHSFYDDEIARFYQREELTSRLTSLFSLLSVFLSCLGLFGLAVFSIEQRTKEIGVRKVLGASVMSITGLLSKDFLRLVLIAIVIASPAAYYFMDKWLQDFAFRIDIEWWIFASSALVAAGIALVTVSFHSIKAALMNPVESLKRD
jgi:putative ABC transport system permease protein